MPSAPASLPVSRRPHRRRRVFQARLAANTSSKRFGKPLTVTRSGSYADIAVSAVRRYVYDANARLYTPDGLVASLVANNLGSNNAPVTTTHAYNKRQRMVTNARICPCAIQEDKLTIGSSP